MEQVQNLFFSWIPRFFAEDRFLLPFFATLGASLTLLLIQSLNREIGDRRKKLYAATYMLDACFRILKSSLIIRKHTVLPHIEATSRILAGDGALLEKMFESDDFDILRSKSLAFSHLPEEYKVLVGLDDIELVQAFETANYLYEDETTREGLNEFVKEQLKSVHAFVQMDSAKKVDVLSTYQDHLGRVDHQINRAIFFVCRMVVPRIEDYVGTLQFFLFRTKEAKGILKKIHDEKAMEKDLIPDDDYMNRVKMSGIQKAL